MTEELNMTSGRGVLSRALHLTKVNGLFHVAALQISDICIFFKQAEDTACALVEHELTFRGRGSPAI